MTNFNTNINTNLQYHEPHNFYEVMTEINAHLPNVAYSYRIGAQAGCKVQDHITNLEKSSGSNRVEIASLDRRITKIENEYNHPTVGSMAKRVAATAALVLAYIVLAATVIGLSIILLLELEFHTFARVSKGYLALENDKSRLSSLRQQLKNEEDSLVGFNELKAKAPQAIQTLEQRIALLKQTEAEILANASKNQMWHALVGQNSRILHQYESALRWFNQAVLAA